MFNIIKTYIFKPNYYEYNKIDYSGEYLKIFNNKNLYLYINIYATRYLKIKQIKQNYIITSYFDHHNNTINLTKIKNFDNTNLDIINDGYYDGCYKYNFDFRINTNAITKKIDKDMYIIYFHTKYIIKDINIKDIKDINIKAIRYHYLYNSGKCYYKFYKTYYINYYIIINIDMKNTVKNCNTIFCNYSRNFMLFI